MQSELQTGNPKGTFKRWDEHPSVEDLVFNKWNTKKGEVWSQLEDLQKMEANKKAYLEIPSVKEKTKAHHKVYRQQNLEKVFKNQQKHLYKIQHIYDWQKTPEYKAYLKAHKKGVQNRISRRWIEKPGNRAIHNVRSKRYDDAHREEIRQYGKEYRDTKRQQRTEALNQFYRTHDVPEYLWHKDEFAAEEDFHSALEHVIVSRFGLDIERCFLEEIGRPDIYIPFLDLFLEVKLLSSMWRRDSVAEQSLRYSEIEYTIIVSLDGEPAYWTEAPPVPWMNPEELFGFIAEILEPDK